MAKRSSQSKKQRDVYMTTWRAANPDRVKEIKRRYYERHKERLKAETSRRRNAKREQDPDAFRAAQREVSRQRWHKDREGHRLAAITRRYGMSREDYCAMSEAQGSACAICRTPFADIKRLCVDHCHQTGQVRGLLCNGCNVGLAHFGDDPRRTTAATDYLLRHTVLP
jgi:Recombination endonuclease VII